MTDDHACRCGRIRVGTTVTQHRNWNPDCIEHGVESAWYKSPEQVEKRAKMNERLRALQAEAKAKRAEARDA